MRWREEAPSWSTVVVRLEEGGPRKVSFGGDERGKASVGGRVAGKLEGKVSRGTQTDYRESEAQTVPWKHDVKTAGSFLQQLLSLDWLSLSPEKDSPVSLGEVRLIEATRERLAWESAIKSLRGAANERARPWLALKRTAIEGKLKEKKREAENDERMEITSREMREKKKRFEEKVELRLLRLYEHKRTENVLKVSHWRHQLLRGLRKMKSGRSHSAEKANVVAMHLDKGSNLYAPKLRDGENPSLGHEIIRIQCRYLKRFHELETLERNLFHVPHSIFAASCPDLHSSTPRKAYLCLRKFRGKALESPNEREFDGSSVKVAVAVPAAESGLGPRSRSSPGSTPETRTRNLESEEDVELACLLLQRLVKGRAVQNKMFEEILRQGRGDVG